MTEYTARDALLSLTDQSNWPEFLNDQERIGYSEAMEIVHDMVMAFWSELTTEVFKENSS